MLLLTVIGLLTLGCQNPPTKAESEVVDTKPTTTIDGQKITKKDRTPQPGEEMKSSYNRDHTNKRGSALSILNFRISADAENYPIIEDGIWEFEFIHDGTGMSKEGEHDGEWIDFKDDHTYAKGKGKEQQSTGKYHYDFSTDKVLMIPDDNKSNPQEWKTIFGTDIVMIMVGTPEYGNNNFQMKLKRRKSLDEI